MYNKNIILNILSNIFGIEIETYVQKCIMRMEKEELEEYFGEEEVDYAMLHFLHQIIIENYEIEIEDENQEIISGTVEVEAEIDGFSFEEEKSVYKDSTEITIGLLYEFHACNGEYKDLYLEYLY